MKVYLSALLFAASTFASASPLNYTCKFGEEGKVTVGVSLNTKANLLTVETSDARVSGNASVTFEKATGISYYLIQGANHPTGQFFRLAIKDGGKWAAFSQVTGADFICEPSDGGAN